MDADSTAQFYSDDYDATTIMTVEQVRVGKEAIAVH